MDAPEISVLLPVFNGERHLRQAIESILAQDLGNFELLVIDDGSTDASRDIARAIKDNRVRLLLNERNQGLPWTLNRGIREARAELLARQDHDDVAEPGRFSKQWKFLNERSDIAVVASQVSYIDETGRAIAHAFSESELSPMEVEWGLLRANPVAHSSVMMRKRVVEEVGAYPENYRNYGDDYSLWWRIARTHRLAVLGDALQQIRHHATNNSAIHRSANQVETAAVLVEELSVRLENAPSQAAADYLRQMTPDNEVERDAAAEAIRIQTAFFRYLVAKHSPDAQSRRAVANRFKRSLRRLLAGARRSKLLMRLQVMEAMLKTTITI